MVEGLDVAYVKCVLVGIAAVSIEALAMVAWRLWAEYEIKKAMPGIYLVHLRPSHDVWRLVSFSLLVFAAGFWWQHRKGRVRPVS
jgi:hypothetical protein